jgi:cation:H+ antiporter
LINQGVILIAGLAALYFGAESLVKGGSRLALSMGMKPILIGLTVVAFGTSLPEFSVAVISSASRANAISLGNVIGSNICNILLVFGAMALIRPVEVDSDNLRKDLPAMMASGALLWILSADGEITRLDGALMILGFLIYLRMLWEARKSRFQSDIDTIRKKASIGHYALIPIGLGLLIFGGWACVRSGTSIAEYFGIAEYTVGLTIVAFGTVLPELSVGIVSSIRKSQDLTIGNSLGSFIFNSLGVIGIAALIHPYEVAPDINSFGLPVMVASSMAFLPIASTGQRVTRIEGAGFLIAYVVYILALF